MADVQLPDEVTSALQEHEEKNAKHLEAIGIAIAGKRSEAVAARKDSGIETVWMEAEEAYLGIDASNRGAWANKKWAKPTTMSGPLTANGVVQAAAGEVQSTAFVRLTSRYVDAGAAKLGEILLPADEKAFSFTNTPAPELVNALKDNTQAVHDGVPLTRPAPATPGATAPLQGADPTAPNAAAAPAAPGSLPISGTVTPNPGTDVPVLVKDIAQEAIDAAQASAKKAEKRIHDWMVQSRFRAEGRKIIFDAARIGVGVLKGPFPRKDITRGLVNGALKINRRTVPAYEWKDPWNIFPDPACGENIHDGDHIFECDRFSTKQLRNLKGQPGYIDSAIDAVLLEGPSGGINEAMKPGEQVNKHRFVIWYYYGTLKREDFVQAATGGNGYLPDEKLKEEVYAIVTMVNDTVIRASINPLDSGEFPYHSVPWQRRPGHWAGVGVSEQLEMPQRAINAAIRALFNNAGKSAGSIIVHDRSSVTPADNSPVITPDKVYYKNEDSSTDDVRKAFAFFSVPNMTPQLLTVIELCLKLAEESTNIPLVTQGQSGTTTPETYGAAQLQNNNANQLLRSVGYGFDDYITEPVVNQSYEYLLLDPEVPEDEKGDWHIDAHGSVALVERAIQDQTVMQMGEFAINPAFGVDPKKWFAEFSKTKHLNPKNFQFTPEEQAKIDAMPKPAAPAIEVAKIKVADAEKARAADAQLEQVRGQIAKMLEDAAGQVKLQIAEGRKAVDEMRVKVDTDRDTAYVQAETARTTNQHLERMKELELKERIALLEASNARGETVDKIKADLAKTSMTLNVQRELSHKDTAAELHMHHNPPPQVAEPAAEPAGKAPAGSAFTA